MIRFTITAGGLSTSCEADGQAHPDLLDEMATRTVRLFVDTQASLPDEDGGDERPADHG